MNIHHANLFPDPGGASKYSNDWLSRVIEEERRDAAEALALTKAAEAQPAGAVPPLIADGMETPDAITGLLRSLLPNDSDFPSDVLDGWASKLITLYERTAETDWPERPASQLRLKLAFRKFLMSIGVHQAVAETGALRLIEFFSARWKATNAS